MNAEPHRTDAPGRLAPGPGMARATVGRSLILKVDLCRGLFAFLVVVAHSYDVCWVLHPEAIQALPPSVRAVLACTVQSGHYWVMGFFVISGYCIQLSVGRLDGPGRFPLPIYLAARLSRIAPLYYAGLAFALAVECLVAPIRPPFYPDGVDQVGWISQLFFVQRFTRTFGAFAPSWTITNELFYYVFFGLLAAVASGYRARPAWIGMGLCVAIGGAMQGLYATGSKNWFTLNVGLLFGLGTIWFLGALVAVHGPSLVKSRAVRALSLAWPLGLAASAALSAQARVPLQGIYLLLGFTFAGMLLRFQAVEEARTGPEAAPPGWLAKLAEVVGLASYPTYLFHGPILLLLAAAIGRRGLVADWRATWAVLAASGIGAGLALGWLAERPIMAWRADLLRRLKRPGATPTTPARRPILEPTRP